MNSGIGQQRNTQSSSPQFSLVISTKDGTRPLRPLTEAKVTIGRDRSNDIIINENVISAFHITLLKVSEGKYTLTNLSENGITYQEKLLKHEEAIILKHRDVFHIMTDRKIYATLTFYDKKEQGGIQASNLKKNIKKRFKKPKIVLNDISLILPPCKFIAIVGGSGAGKSTLLKALNGVCPADSGDLLYNGDNYYESLAEFSTQIGYVPQDDIVHRDLTVERALYYGAKLRPSTGEPIETRIDKVLARLELTESKTKLIKELSGGQRKRVSIALELLADPKMLFLDEPTSGLDPALDYKIMEELRILADKGHTIVLVTHATENIHLCDYVCFLHRGRLVYFGNPSQALLFFTNLLKSSYTLLDKSANFEITNFVDIYRLLDKQIPSAATPLNTSSSQRTESVSEKAIKVFHQTNEFMQYCVPKQNSSAGNLTAPISPLKRVNQWKQFGFLTLRYIELFKNDWRNFLFLMLQPLIIAAILVCFIKSGIGTDGFEATNVVQCPTTAQVFTKDGYVDVPHIAPDISSPASMPISFSCSDLERSLQKNQAGQRYAANHGGTLQSLQNFISPGPGDAPTILFIMAFAAIMFGCVNAVREIVKETIIYEREYTIGVGNFPYLFSKIVVLGVICLLQSAILVGIVHLVDPFPGTFLSGIGEIYLTILLTSWAGLMMGLLVSAIVTNNELATSLIPLLLLPQVIFSGTLFPLTKQYPFLQWLGAIFPIRWSMAALGSSVGLHSDKINGDQLFGNNYIYHGNIYSIYSNTDTIHYLQLMWVALGIMIIVFISMTLIFLLVKGRRRWRITYLLLQWKQKRIHRGSSSTQLCSHCGAFLRLGARFCSKCQEKQKL